MKASPKLGEKDARALVKAASRVLVAKSKKVTRFDPKKATLKEITTAMLGQTGNLRTPTLRAGKTVVVGFDQELYEELFG